MSTGPDRPATPADVGEIALSLPEVTFATSWGDRPTYLVADKGFVLYRAPHKTAVDPVTGEMWDDLLVVHCRSLEDKAELVADPTWPFFTIDHFNRYPAVLLRLSQIGELRRDELAAVITDAWWAKAIPRLRKAHPELAGNA